MAKRKRTDNTMAKGKRTDNIIAKRKRTNNDLQNITVCKLFLFMTIFYYNPATPSTKRASTIHKLGTS
jgi:hypothetical protein